MAVVAGERLGVVQVVLLALIRLYQWSLGLLLGGHCRFHPSCSHYGLEAIRRHGAWRGAGLTAWRVVRCHPFHPGGVDLVPQPRQRR
jgi:hypothetical protein